MSKRTSYPHGSPTWIDLSSTDIRGAQDFYSAVFGWDLQGGPTPDGGEYFMALQDGAPVAGMMQQPQSMADAGVPTVWSTYFAVDSVDDAITAGTGAGATVVMPATDVMDTGRMAFLTDTVGAAYGVWQAGTHHGAGVVNAPNAWTWSELITGDGDAAADFYAAALGLKADTQDFGGSPYTFFAVGDETVGGITPPQMDGVPPHWHVWFGAADVAATVAAVKAHGGMIFVEPMETPIGLIAVAQDPQGGAFSLVQLNEWPD